MTNLAVIPARGGSKRIRRKNVRPFAGKPMIAWSIEAARASGCFERIVVSTDDDEIAAVARAYGVEVPFVRPAELSDDHTPTIPVVAHAVEWESRHGRAPQAVCCLYATAPFVQPADLQRGHELLRREGCDYVFPVAPYAAPIQRALRITAEGRAQMFWPENFGLRSQDLEPAFHDAGAFYWGRPQAWLHGVPIFSAGAVPMPLPRWRVQDIDTPDDWERAELMFAALAARGAAA
jgi:N-acylneuraminate cytidylyltransferase